MKPNVGLSRFGGDTSSNIKLVCRGLLTRSHVTQCWSVTVLPFEIVREFPGPAVVDHPGVALVTGVCGGHVTVGTLTPTCDSRDTDTDM